MPNNISKRLKQLDLFGTTVNFTYRGDDYYTTRCGSSVTILAVTIFVILAGIKFVEFFGSTDPIEYMTEAKQPMDEKIDLDSLGFTFAIEKLDPAYGRLVVEQVVWDGITGE